MAHGSNIPGRRGDNSVVIVLILNEQTYEASFYASL